ncbi:MATE family efflux transporter [Aestuariispira insulae]|uniref:Multidrug-efflux transporter n=1 Tax=Aestuariispira insulae TaxID=1461337 RepID=A0A3D9HSL4_9PROT|nr:MATE family efflux transporter [Aestuariispira insulae]RED52498.1 MATE family multidrug resistance protein [Aestuariispira insulae]
MTAPAPLYSMFGSPLGEARGEVRRLLGISWPLALSYVGHIAIGTTDVLMIGRLGAEELASSAVAISVYYGFYMFCMGVVIAVTPLASQALGAGDPRMARRAVRQGIWVALTLAVPAMILLWQIDWVLNILFQDQRLIGRATGYMHFFMWGMVFTLMYDAMRCFMIALGRARPTLYITIVGIILNAVLNYGLLFGNLGLPEMGLPGAGLSSLLVNATMFLICLSILYTRLPYRRYHILGRLWRPDWSLYRQIFKLGVPIGIGFMLEQGMFSAATLTAGSIGPNETAAHAIAMNIVTVAFMIASGLAEEGLISTGTLLAGLFSPIEVAAHAIALQWISIAYMVGLGFSGAASTRAGFFMGRKDVSGIRRACLSSLFMALGFMGCFALLFTFFPYELSQVFLDPETPDAQQVLMLAASLLAVAALFQITDGLQLIMAGTLNGISDMLAASMIGLVCYWGIGISAAVLFGFYLEAGVIGIWWGMALGLVTAALAYMIRFYFKTADERLFDD